MKERHTHTHTHRHVFTIINGIINNSMNEHPLLTMSATHNEFVNVHTRASILKCFSHIVLLWLARDLISLVSLFKTYRDNFNMVLMLLLITHVIESSTLYLVLFLLLLLPRLRFFSSSSSSSSFLPVRRHITVNKMC